MESEGLWVIVKAIGMEKGMQTFKQETMVPSLWAHMETAALCQIS